MKEFVIDCLKELIRILKGHKKRKSYSPLTPSDRLNIINAMLYEMNLKKLELKDELEKLITDIPANEKMNEVHKKSISVILNELKTIDDILQLIVNKIHKITYKKTCIL